LLAEKSINMVFKSFQFTFVYSNKNDK